MALFPRGENEALERIINSDGISKHLSVEYPNVYKLLQWNLEETAGMLAMVGAFQLLKIDQLLRYEQHGSDNIKTWSEYREGVHQYLKSINDDRRLQQARTVLADHIHDVHIERFPCWPSVADMKQQSEVFIDVASSYPFESWYVGWSCLGYIYVQDFRANTDSYYTDFHGRPQLKILYCNSRRLKEFEQLASIDMDAARGHIEGQRQGITWGDILT